MFQRDLIEIHMSLLNDGWDIQSEMTNGNARDSKVINYTLSHSKLDPEISKIVLNFPIASDTGKYELLVGKNLPQLYNSEEDAQFSLLEICKGMLSNDQIKSA